MPGQRMLTVVGCHAGGEIGNVVIGGGLPLRGRSVFEQTQALRADDFFLVGGEGLEPPTPCL